MKGGGCSELRSHHCTLLPGQQNKTLFQKYKTKTKTKKQPKMQSNAEFKDLGVDPVVIKHIQVNKASEMCHQTSRVHIGVLPATLR